MTAIERERDILDTCFIPSKCRARGWCRTLETDHLPAFPSGILLTGSECSITIYSQKSLKASFASLEATWSCVSCVGTRLQAAQAHVVPRQICITGCDWQGRSKKPVHWRRHFASTWGVEVATACLSFGWSFRLVSAV